MQKYCHKIILNLTTECLLAPVSLDLQGNGLFIIILDSLTCSFRQIIKHPCLPAAIPAIIRYVQHIAKYMAVGFGFPPFSLFDVI